MVKLLNKRMERKELRNIAKFSPIIVVFCLGILGGIVRGLELINAIDVRTGIYDFGGMAFLLPIISVAAVVFSVLTMKKYGKYKDVKYADIMKSDCNILTAISCIGAVIIMLAGVLNAVMAVTDFELRYLISTLTDGIIGIKQFVTSPTFTSSVTDIFFAILTVFAGAAFFSIARKNKNGDVNDYTELLMNVPMFWTCFVFIFTFIEHPVEPVVPIYAYDLLASCFLVLAVYNFTAIAYRRKSIFMAMVTSLCAIYFMMTVAIGRIIHILAQSDMYYLKDAPFRMVYYGAMFLILIVNVVTVIKNGARFEGESQQD